jgi:hypothetical protein
MTDWVRLWHDMPTDPKWRVIARKSGQPLASVIALFTLMMTEASAADDRGSIAGMKIEDAAAALDMEEGAVMAILAEMDARVIKDGRLSGWERRQPKREDGASERAAAWRERKRTQASAVKRPETETETETETEEASASCARPRETPVRDVDATADLRQAIVVEFQRANSPVIPDTSRAAVWLAKGWRPEIIIPTIAEILAKNPNARSLAYFEPAIADAHASPVARAPPSHAPPRRLTIIDGLALHDARTSQS